MMAYREDGKQFDAPTPFIEGVHFLQEHFDRLVDKQLIAYDTCQGLSVAPTAPDGVLQLDPSLTNLSEAYQGLIHIADARSLARLSDEPKASGFDIVRQHGPRVGRIIGYNPTKSNDFSTRPRYEECQKRSLENVRSLRRTIDGNRVTSAGVTLAAEIGIGQVILPNVMFEPITDEAVLEVIHGGILRAKSKRQSAA